MRMLEHKKINGGANLPNNTKSLKTYKHKDLLHSYRSFVLSLSWFLGQIGYCVVLRIVFMLACKFGYALVTGGGHTKLNMSNCVAGKQEI